MIGLIAKIFLKFWFLKYTYIVSRKSPVFCSSVFIYDVFFSMKYNIYILHGASKLRVEIMRVGT